MVFHWVRDLQSVLYEDIIRRKKQAPFIIFISFIIAFAAARLTVNLGPEWLRLIIRQYHIHHFYYGFALIAVSNWIALTTDRKHMFHFAAGLFGVGLGFIVDELGLLLTCTTPALKCDYYARQTFDIFMVLAGVFLAALYSTPIISGLKRIARKFASSMK
jgi:hypothetical protein